jgi:hypothetical protein
MAWLFPDGGPFNVPGADMMGVLPLGLVGIGVDVGLSRIPSGMGIAVKVGPWAIVGTAISARQWARRPRYIGCSQDVVAKGVEVFASVVVGDAARGRLILGRCDGMGCGSAARIVILGREAEYGWFWSGWTGENCNRTQEHCADSGLSMDMAAREWRV